EFTGTTPRLADLMTAWDEDLDGVEYRLVVPTDTALATVLQVSRPAVAGMERQGRIAREPDGQWDVWAVIADWRRTTRAAMARRAPSARRKHRYRSRTEDAGSWWRGAGEVGRTRMARRAGPARPATGRHPDRSSRLRGTGSARPRRDPLVAVVLALRRGP